MNLLITETLCAPTRAQKMETLESMLERKKRLLILLTPLCDMIGAYLPS